MPATPASLRSALLLFLGAAFETQPGLVPHLLREQNQTIPLLDAMLQLLQDEKTDAMQRKQALAAIGARLLN